MALPTKEDIDSVIQASEKMLQAATITRMQRKFFTASIVLIILLLIANGIGIIVATKTGLRVRDCTEAGHPCYEEGQKRGAEFVELIQKVTLAINQCADSVDGDTEIEECVQTKLANLFNQ